MSSTSDLVRENMIVIIAFNNKKETLLTNGKLTEHQNITEYKMFKRLYKKKQIWFLI